MFCRYWPSESLDSLEKRLSILVGSPFSSTVGKEIEKEKNKEIRKLVQPISRKKKKKSNSSKNHIYSESARNNKGTLFVFS